MPNTTYAIAHADHYLIYPMAYRNKCRLKVCTQFIQRWLKVHLYCVSRRETKERRLIPKVDVPVVWSCEGEGRISVQCLKKVYLGSFRSHSSDGSKKFYVCLCCIEPYRYVSPYVLLVCISTDNCCKRFMCCVWVLFYFVGRTLL